ncbi:MAG: CCA tRNA nucleotidyltransferase [Armatimonadota bacterium]|nr:CCA tRNA nucleotidyltransferase [Armatimonadota bacterium]MDR5702806.1 CCA tRNA nucleotidyltransferase [Armatimonadota bacterium]MDR7435945.1 CCA tRNA nucleotidyltransferase [Armatimonadota bacterium]
MELTALAIEVIRRLRDAGFAAYFVGGCVRDQLLGRPPHDVDIVTSASPEEVLRLFPESVTVGAKFGVVRVRIDSREFEVATFREEGPYSDGRHPSYVRFADAHSDVRRRDFTINGLLYDPLEGRVLDLVGGLEDLRSRLIRTIGDPRERFGEDKLRMLRAVRLAVELDFQIAPEVAEAIQAMADQITVVSAERIREELVRILTGPAPGKGIRLLHEVGLLGVILPEVQAMAGIPQPDAFHPEGDVFTHTVLALDHLHAPSAVLAMGVLLHDVGKPPTYTVEDRVRFPRHDEVGAEIAQRICRRLRFSNEEIERIVALVREHMRFKDLPRMRPAKARRFLSRPDFLDHLELHRVDCLASHGDLSTYEWAKEAYTRLSKEEPMPPRLLTGDDLIGLGLKPGPRFREILAAVEDEQLEGRISTKEEALTFVKRLLQEQ